MFFLIVILIFFFFPFLLLGFVNLKKEKSESNSNVGLSAWKLAEKLSSKNELPIVKDVLQKKV